MSSLTLLRKSSGKHVSARKRSWRWSGRSRRSPRLLIEQLEDRTLLPPLLTSSSKFRSVEIPSLNQG